MTCFFLFKVVQLSLLWEFGPVIGLRLSLVNFKILKLQNRLFVEVVHDEIFEILSWKGQNQSPLGQVYNSACLRIKKYSVPALCSSFPYSVPLTHMHQNVKVTMACHFRPCHDSGPTFLPLLMKPSPPSQQLCQIVDVAFQPTLPAACLYLSADLMCDLSIFSHTWMKSYVWFWVTPCFQDLSLQWYSWKHLLLKKWYRISKRILQIFIFCWYRHAWKSGFSCQSSNTKHVGKFQV